MIAARKGGFAPSRVRGLKRNLRVVKTSQYKFAPSRVRGLKHDISNIAVRVIWFAPSRVRGLKHMQRSSGLTLSVRTFTGAWIETFLPNVSVA